MAMKRETALLLLMLCWCVPIQAGNVYKWVDEQGRVHYGEQPPAAAKAREMPLQEAPSGGMGVEESRAEQQQRLLRAFEEERALKAEQQQKAQAEQEQRQQNCAHARDRLRRYQSAGSIYDLDKKSGDRRTLSDAERAATVQQAEAAVKQWCK